MDKEQDLFYLTFIDEFVEILIPIYQKNIEGDENGVSDQTLPLVIQGYIIDMDHNRIYLGDTPEEITHSLFRDDAKLIRIIKETNPYDDILEHMPTPENKEEEN